MNEKSDGAMGRVEELLRRTASCGVSDLIISAGKPPSARRYGQVLPLQDEQEFTDEEIAEFRRQILLPEAEAKFRATGGFDTGITFEDNSRFRINFLVRQGRPALVARPVPSGELSFTELGLPGKLADFAAAPRGLVIVVGAAGSGKSTTLAAMVNHINAHFNKHVVTIEDPIEHFHRDLKSVVTQREVGSDTASFADALSQVVRESPDVILIGETRDLETTRSAIAAALTGHLVLTSMHAADAAGCVERIVNHFPDHLRGQAAADVALALRAVVGMRLVPGAEGGGMIPAVEILDASPFVKSLVASRKFGELEEAMRRGGEEGMKTFNRALSELYHQDKISLDTGAAIATNRDEFILLARGMESGVDTFRGTRGEGSGDDDINMKRLLHSSVANLASDLILTAGSPPALRVNGDITTLAVPPLTGADTKRLLFSVLNSHQRAVFEEMREVDFALTLNIRRSSDPEDSPGAPYRFRLNGFFQRGNIGIAARVVPQTVPSPEELGLPAAVIRLADRRHGLVLVTGPTGHGKSTTLASLIDRINSRRGCHIITVEDPIEYVHPNKKAILEQREVHADTLSFANALKYVLRQNPDVILVGEMRDTETIAAALTAAETGHLVLATLHTNSAYQSIDRIIDSFPAHQQNQIRLQLSGTLLGVVSQRLVPKANGDGRVALFEVLIGSPAIRSLIREGKTHLMPSSMETGARDGMITMDRAIENLVKSGAVRAADCENLRSAMAN